MLISKTAVQAGLNCPPLVGRGRLAIRILPAFPPLCRSPEIELEQDGKRFLLRTPTVQTLWLRRRRRHRSCFLDGIAANRVSPGPLRLSDKRRLPPFLRLGSSGLRMSARETVMNQLVPFPRLRSRRGPPPCLSLGRTRCSPTSRAASWPRTVWLAPNICRATSAPSLGASTAALS
jgi:hypothetical protein